MRLLSTQNVASMYVHMMIVCVHCKCNLVGIVSWCIVYFVGFQYWELLAHLLYSLEGREEHEIAEQQLEDELQWLSSAPAAVEDDDRVPF